MPSNSEETKPVLPVRRFFLIVLGIFLLFLLVVGLIFISRLNNIPNNVIPDGNNPDGVQTTTVTPKEDATIVLANPLAGITENNLAADWWPSKTIAISDQKSCLKLQGDKGADCITIDWAKLNPEQGKYDFAQIDKFIQEAKQKQKYVVIRVSNVASTAVAPVIPEWAKKAGVTSSTGTDPLTKISGTEIDYHKCSFLDVWDDLVQELAKKYSSNAQVLGFDIGSYGFGGSWQSGKTVLTESAERDANDPTFNQSKDTRARIIRMFTGGKGAGKCIGTNGQEQTVNYDYAGIKNKLTFISANNADDTSLAAIDNSAGIRFDQLNVAADKLLALRNQYTQIIDNTWKEKPVIAELANDFVVNADNVQRLVCFVRENHITSLQHNFTAKPDINQLGALLKLLGHRIVLTEAVYPVELNSGQETAFKFSWVNKGSAPAYQSFPLTLFFKPKDTETVVASVSLSETDLRRILPADVAQKNNEFNSCNLSQPQTLTTTEKFTVPSILPNGDYDVYFGFIDPVYNQPLQLGLEQKDRAGRYLLGNVKVVGSSATNLPIQNSCGDGQIQTPNTSGTKEVCDDGNAADNDQCSANCLHSCTAPQVWDGSACVQPKPQIGFRCALGQCVEVTDGTGTHTNMSDCMRACNPPVAAICGDNKCSEGETVICPEDCRSTAPICGDNQCSEGESVICPQDCQSAIPICGDNRCAEGETVVCPQDCNIPQCSDGIDNDSDGWFDKLDSSCHTDGNVANEASYDPKRTNEAAVVTPPVTTTPRSTVPVPRQLPRTALEDDLLTIMIAFLLMTLGFVAYKKQVGKAFFSNIFSKFQFELRASDFEEATEKNARRKRR
jgi:cysteine-rich repeat protein